MNKVLKKVRFVCNPALKVKFQESHCLYSISLGNPLEEGVCAESTLFKINQCFKKCTIMLADTLQRYNYVDRNFGEQDTLRKGDEWLKAQAESIQQLNIPVMILRWNSIRNSSEFFDKLLLVQNLYKSSISFYEAVQTSINLFLRKSRSITIASCLDYLFEECAVLIMLSNKQYDFEIYPSQRIPAMEYVYEKLIKYKAPMKLIPISLELRTRKPQACIENL